MTVNEDEKWEQRRLQHIAKNYGLKRGSVRNQGIKQISFFYVVVYYIFYRFGRRWNGLM